MADLHHELHAHAASLRCLARDLLRDAHAADDVTQATLHQALARPPQDDGPLGGWLHRTLVNFVRQWRRGERRRATHEGAVPARGAEPAAADVLARRETLRAVTDAVLRLDEPYQTAVFLRYFEDLPPRTIARRTNTNVATVKSRLARGLAMLRTRLDTNAGGRRTGSWRPALATAFGVPLSPLLPFPIGALLVSSTTKILCAAGVLCASGLFVFGRGDDPAPTTGTAVVASTDVAAVAASSAHDAAVEAVERNEAASPVADVPWLAHPFEVTLEVLVVDDLGMPIENHSLQVAPVGCALNRAERASGADGRATVTWRTRTPRIDAELMTPLGALRRVTLEHGKPLHLVLLGSAPVPSRIKLSTSIRLAHGVGLLETIPIVGSMFTSDHDGDTKMRAGLHPFAMFTDPCGRVPELQLPAADTYTAVAGVRLAESVRYRVDRTVSAEPPTAAAQTAITGTVFGEDGNPTANVPVLLLGSGPQPLQRTATDEQGRFRFEGVVVGEFTVRAGGDTNGLATARAIVTTGETPAVLQLRRGACVRGRAIDPDGKPIADARVEWRALDGTWVDGATTGDDGAFLFANVTGPGSLLLTNHNVGHTLPIASLPSVLPDTSDVVLQAAAGPGALCIAAAEPSDGARILVWPCDTNAGATAHVTVDPRSDDGENGATVERRAPPPRTGVSWSLRNLPAGFYDVELRAAGGRQHFGRHWVDGKSVCDLGQVSMPNAGTVEFSFSDADLPADSSQRAFELIAVRADADVRVGPWQQDRPLQLPPGDYALAFRDSGGSIQLRRFTVAAGQTTKVTTWR